MAPVGLQDACRHCRNHAMKTAQQVDTAGDDIGQRLVRAAADCFARDGYAGTSTASIAREARTSKRALYERFPNKEALFEHVMREICARANVAAGRGTPDAGADVSLEDQLRMLGRAVVDRFAMPETRAIFIAAVSAIPDAGNVIDIFWDEGPGQAATAIEKALTREKRKGNVRVARPKDAARWFVLECSGPVVLGQMFDAGFSISRRDIDAHVEAVVDRFLRRFDAQ